MCNALDDQEDHSKRKNFLIKYVGDCLGTLLKTFKAPFLPLFDELLPYLMPMWGKDRTDEEKRIAICIFDDVAEHCGDAAVKLLFTGLACVQSMVELHLDHMLAALSRLDVVIRRPDALHPDNVMAYDNAVSALGKILQVHRDSINVAQVILVFLYRIYQINMFLTQWRTKKFFAWGAYEVFNHIFKGCGWIVPAWLNCLPIKGDLIEAKVMHDQLCSMVERSDGELLGLNHQYLPKIVGVFADVLSVGKDLASEETATRMINLLRQLQQTLPPSAMASTLSSLQPQQLALQSVLSS
ncbi:putative armadillo-like helical, importin beta family [Helianthus anomalus]